MYIEVDAFVIHKRRIHDHNFFVSLLSRQHGRLSAFAKSAAKGKYHSQFEPLNHNKIQLYKGNKNFTITQSRIIDSHSVLKNNYQGAQVLFALAEILSAVIAEEESAPEILFEIVTEHLKMMKKNLRKVTLLLESFKIKLCRERGIMNELEACHHCHSKLSIAESSIDFCFDYHGFLCKNCRKQSTESINISLKAAKLLKFLSKNPAVEICRLELAMPELFEIAKITGLILERHCHKTFQSETFFRNSPVPELLTSSSLP